MQIKIVNNYCFKCLERLPKTLWFIHTYAINFQQLNEQIAHYKDQLQELKAKTNLEAKFIKKECQVI